MFNVIEPTHAWLGGKLKHAQWFWSRQKKIINTQKLPWCEYLENDRFDACLNLDRKMHDQPKIYGLKCQQKQPFICTLSIKLYSTKIQ